MRHRKADSLRRRHLARQHRTVPRPYNPSVDAAPTGRGAFLVRSRRLRGGGRQLLAALPWLGLTALIGGGIARASGAVPAAWVGAVGLGLGALAVPPSRLLLARGERLAPAAADGCRALVCLGAGLLPALLLDRSPIAIVLALACALLIDGGIALGGLGPWSGNPRGAWSWRGASAVLAAVGSWNLIAGAIGLAGGTPSPLPRLALAAALIPIALVPLALLALGLERDPSAEPVPTAQASEVD